MAFDENLMDAVARFTDEDVDAFRQEWNSQGKAESEEKQKVFDDALSKTSGKNLMAGGISALVSLKYLSLSGETKERDVVLRRVFKNKDEIFIDALCLDINEPRLIKFKNILQLVDKNKKTLYANPANFFENVLGISLYSPKDTKTEESSSLLKGELKTAIELTRYEITALLFISALDGDKNIKELQTIVDYVHTRCPNLSFEDEDLLDYLNTFYPDNQSFYFALERILGQDGWIVKMFVEKMLNLIKADGRVDEKEKLFLADFLRILEEDGFQLNFKK